MATFTRHGQTMNYQDVGQGPVLLLGHSYLWSSEMWQPQIEVLSQNYRCIVPDLWAHGQSEALPQETSTLQDYAGDLLALMDHLEIQEFSIIGLSVGGMWGTEVVTLAPSRVKSLVIMDSFVGLEPEITHAKYFGMLDAISQAQSVPAPILDAVVPLFFADNAEVDSPELVANFRESLNQLQGDAAVNIAQVGRVVFGRRDQFEDIEKFALPVLIMVGDQDKPRPVFESHLMQDAITGSELVVIPNAGHISNLEQPEFVNEKLTGFLEKVYA
ncbi:putative Beta-ketoadipate enol-lactone hydrolase [Vibrio nigripulchritudo MADA3029]|uniref:alpha/beta fold hydrolase n=1 Tax=Vibrio nigripulchritudo TaxID=28173 RepID=UPI0003B18159|nr:alpha/beta fold hydrolase [Vibrio nigripulchritudo]CCN45171.1 putative Beta-ketoadipate enol-lactone hydrolase [Vibrio nigripulchritudo MADA3020]CCN54509.1 putative Beta-ketoadipate enol-lactone hydrolase [Vibrio nigripulchritudo MADA3021]CCN57559.1 putative Beta-ketoadipate enol-lactone hydrolase [Vibrio nigripulchritudo MADA3029]